MHDLRGSDVLLARILADVKQFLADKAYDAAKRVLDLLEQHDVEAVIPPRPAPIAKNNACMMKRPTNGVTSLKTYFKNSNNKER